MRVGFAAPVSLHSAIGRDSADVSRALVARGHAVKIIATEIEDVCEIGSRADIEIIPWQKLSLDQISRDFDVLVVGIGDNYTFHGGAFSLFGAVPTVGIFHDFYLYNLFSGWLWQGGARADDERGWLHDQQVAQTYGSHAGADAVAARSGALSLADIAQRLPMTEWMAARCGGALAHSAFYLDRLRARCPGPVQAAAMPVSSRGIPALGPRGSARLSVLTVGVMNPNKCVDKVIAAIAASPALAAALDYHLVGPIEPSERQRLEGLAADLGYLHLTIHGSVDDEVLNAHLTAADVICCLRNPVLEGASGSAIEGLLAGRPLIVADAGFYSDLPNDLVFKVPADIGLASLTAQLERLARDEGLRMHTGAAARLWAESHFNLEAYVLALEGLIHDTISANAVLSIGKNLGGELASLGLTAEDPAVERISAVLSEIFPT